LWLSGVSVLALAVRLSYVLIVKRNDALTGDEPYFHLTASWLTRGFGFTAAPHSGIPSALHPPLFSIVLMPVSWLPSSDTITAQRVVVALVGTATVVVLMLVGRIIAGETVGIIAGCIAAISPTMWINDGVIMSESLVALLVALSLLCSYGYLRHRTLRYALALGFCCAALTLTRTEYLLVIPVAALLPLVRPRSSRARSHCISIAMVALVSLTPWIAYNLSRFEQPVFISSNLGGILCGSYNPKTFEGGEIGLWDRSACPVPTRPPADQSVLSDFWTSHSLDYLKDNVDGLPLAVVARIGRWVGLYAPNQIADFEEGTGGRPPFVSWLSLVAFLALLPFAFIGLRAMRRRHLPSTPLLVPIALSFVVAIVFYGEVRYRVGADVSLILLAALGGHALLPARADEAQRRARSGTETSPVPTSAA
jgi:4-amino-4-deoxy-L-arabinose transferase-like glycosyltransferase